MGRDYKGREKAIGHYTSVGKVTSLDRARVPRTRTTMAKSRSFSVAASLPVGFAFHHQLVLLSYHPIFQRPYNFSKLVSFLGANRTKRASVGPQLLRGAI